MHRDIHRPKRCSCEPTKDVRALLVKFPSFLAESPRNFMDNASCIRIPSRLLRSCPVHFVLTKILHLVGRKPRVFEPMRSSFPAKTGGKDHHFGFFQMEQD